MSLPHVHERHRRVSLVLKALITALSLFAVTLACATATSAGYSAWYKRLLYFTQQSNLWIGASAGLSLLFAVHPRLSAHRHTRDVLRVLTYVFTVCITLTGVIFCALLAPFAEENIWSFSSVLTHVVVPLLSVADMFLYDEGAPLSYRCVPLALLPAALYYVISLALGAAGVDFGRGETYPYFFMDTSSALPFFGASLEGERPQLGMGWWLAVLFLFVTGVALLYLHLHPSRRKTHREHL